MIRMQPLMNICSLCVMVDVREQTFSGTIVNNWDDSGILDLLQHLCEMVAYYFRYE